MTLGNYFQIKMFCKISIIRRGISQNNSNLNTIEFIKHKKIGLKVLNQNN